MPLSALALLVLAALLHAAWNLLLKNAGQKYIVLWWGLALSSIISLPILLLQLPIPARIWPFAILSALLEALYDGVLAAAYQKDDFSLVYPIARGGAPALLALWAILFLKETPSLAGKIGLAVLTLGLMVVGSSKWWSLRRQKVGWVGDPPLSAAGRESPLSNPPLFASGPAARTAAGRAGIASPGLAGLGLACLVALIISFYSVVDGAAVRLYDAASYTVLVFVLTAIFGLPVLLRLYGWPAIRATGRFHWRQAAAIGLLSLLAYMLVLIAYSFAPVSYGGAIREISIVFGALAAWLWLKEDFGLLRLAGSLVIFAGLLMIVLAG